MNLKKTLFLLFAIILSWTTIERTSNAQTASAGKLYQHMTDADRSSFVAEQARNVARQMSGTEYEFTSEFETEIRKAVDSYAQRIGNNAGDRLLKGDARFVFERGQVHAPALINAFKARSVSPLMGLYIPLIESEYVNIPTVNSVGALGMFQFLPKTGQRFDLTPLELLDIDKAADAAARYISQNQERFKNDRMKDALALLAYNRGERAVERDVAMFVNDQNRMCSICALTAERDKLDETFQAENVYYVPRFFAAAIIGENPQAFGLRMQPLSSYESKR
jgi:transglycosylase-like protein with SLT domain